MSTLTELQNYFTKLGENYTKYYTDKVKELTDDVKKEITYLSSLDSELSGMMDDISNVDNLGEAIDMASTLCSAFAENPLVAQLMGQIERDYGVSINSPLELVKMVATGGDHPYFKVAASMIQFPITGTGVLLSLNQLVEAAKVLNGMVIAINPAILAEMTSQMETNGGIPDDVVSSLNEARRKLATPQLDGPYKAAIDDVQAAIDALSNARLWAGNMVDNVQKLALTTALNSTYASISEYFTSIKSGASTLTGYINVINNTTISFSGAGKRLGKIRKIRTDIAREVQKMQESIPQAPRIPEYIITLGGIKKMLSLSQPLPSDGTPYPVVTPVTSWDSSIVSEIQSLAGKIIQFTKKPYEVAVFTGYVNELIVKSEEYTLMYANTLLEVEANWASFPGVKELLDTLESVLSELGLDAAADALANGKIDELTSMSDLTATSTGAAFVAIQGIGSIAHNLGLFSLKDSLDTMQAVTKKKVDKQKFENKAKKKNRVSAVKKRLTRLNESFEKFTSFYAELTGLVETVANVVEINT